MTTVNLGEVAVSLLAAQSQLEDTSRKLRRVCITVGLSGMGTELAVEAAEQDVVNVKVAFELMKRISRHEKKILTYLAKCEREPVSLLDRAIIPMRAVAALL